jgi:hypothetical protein
MPFLCVIVRRFLVYTLAFPHCTMGMRRFRPCCRIISTRCLSFHLSCIRCVAPQLKNILAPLQQPEIARANVIFLFPWSRLFIFRSTYVNTPMYIPCLMASVVMNLNKKHVSIHGMHACGMQATHKQTYSFTFIHNQLSLWLFRS